MKITKYLQILFLLLFIIYSKNVQSQNLAPNPSFEQYSICPDNNSQISYCTFWDSYRESPDYFNTCSSNSDYSPPNCYYGFQYPHTGNAYIGICPFHAQFQNALEFAGAPLLSNLVIGQKYFISFYISLGGNLNWGVTVGSNKMGVKFSTVPYSYSNPAPINNTAHYYSNDIVIDTVKWTKISGSFIADSSYSYIIIGNFFNNNNTDTINLAPSNNNYAFYYIDDICVSSDSIYCENWTNIYKKTSEKSITIYPNPAFEKIQINLNDYLAKEIIIKIFNSTGQQLYIDKFENQNLMELDVSTFSKGVYMLEILYDNKLENRKLIIK
ncbi:MAG: T9SS type A sorting domain-containing protein [Bacteroidia bacterium]|nr:T9SS type A sorting domain-containing protein [Bacteroidia bacterium]